MNTSQFAIALLGAGLLMSTTTQAAVVSDLSSVLTVVEDFEDLGFISSGPVNLGGGITASSSIIATYDYLPVDLGTNGAWGIDGYVGIGDYYNFTTTPSASDNLTFSLAVGQFAIGADFSIYKDEFTTGEITLEALDSNGDVLEFTTFTVDLNDIDAFNVSVFKGFLRSENDIFGLRVTGDGFVVDNLTVTTVPVPAALPLFVAGMGFLASRRKRA